MEHVRTVSDQRHSWSCISHVSGCRDRFCAICKVLWHDKQTCQQYRALHPELRDKNEVKQLDEMARLGARRDSRRKLAIVKESKCHHVHCEQRSFVFIFPGAEHVLTSPPDYIPVCRQRSSQLLQSMRPASSSTGRAHQPQTSPSMLARKIYGMGKMSSTTTSKMVCGLLYLRARRNCGR